METILFFIKRKKLLKDGAASIFVRVTFGKLSAEVATGKSVLPSQWVATKGRAKGNTLKTKQVNAFLDQMEYTLHDLTLQIQREGKQVSAKEILNRYKNLNVPKIGILALYAEHNQEQRELIGISVALGTYKRHETSMKLFQEFLMFKYKAKDISVNEVDVDMLKKYQHYLMTVRHNNNNTTVKYLRNLGKVLNLAVMKKLIQSSPLEELKLKIEPVDRGFLNKIELAKLAEKQFDVARLEQVRDVFLFCCYTGLAYIDVHSLTADNVIEESDRLWIRKARHKTNVMCHIPIIKPAKDILEKYSIMAQTTGKLLPVLSNQKMNAYLKEIAAIVGIDKDLTTHLARHTFATTVTLANHVSIENVSKMLGHSSIRMTQHYARILDASIENEMLNVEQNYKGTAEISGA